VAAFKATLQETQEATLLLHVVDYSDEQYLDNIDQVNEVLTEIEADEVPQLIVCNKIDRLDGVEPKIDRDEEGRPIRVWLSAQQNKGIDLLKTALTECLRQEMVSYTLSVPAADGKVRGLLFELNCIKQEHYSERGDWVVDITMLASDWYRLDKKVDHRLSEYVSQ